MRAPQESKESLAEIFAQLNEELGRGGYDVYRVYGLDTLDSDPLGVTSPEQLIDRLRAMGGASLFGSTKTKVAFVTNARSTMSVDGQREPIPSGQWLATKTVTVSDKWPDWTRTAATVGASAAVVGAGLFAAKKARIL